MPSVEVSISFIEVVVEDVGGCALVGLGRHVADRPRQSVGNLVSQPLREAAVDPNLKPVVIRVARRLVPGYVVCKAKPAGCITVSCSCSHRCTCTWNHLVVITIDEAPDVQTMVADVRNFRHSVLHDLARDRNIPLPAFSGPEVWINGVYASQTGCRSSQPWVDGIEAATG